MRNTLILLAAGAFLGACGTITEKDDRPEIVVADSPAKAAPRAPAKAAYIPDHPDTEYIKVHAAAAPEESPDISPDLLAEKKARILVKNYTNEEAKAFKFLPDGPGRPISLPTLLVLRYDDQETVIGEGSYKKITCTLNGTAHTIRGKMHIRAGHTYLLTIKE
jgi:hypothetical protein